MCRICHHANASRQGGAAAASALHQVDLKADRVVQRISSGLAARTTSAAGNPSSLVSVVAPMSNPATMSSRVEDGGDTAHNHIQPELMNRFAARGISVKPPAMAVEVKLEQISMNANVHHSATRRGKPQ